MLARRFQGGLAGLLVALSAASCGASGPQRAEEAPSQGTAPPPATKASLMPQTENGVLGPGEADRLLKANMPPIVRVLSPGSEPRDELEYSLGHGSKRGIDMSMDMEMVLGLPGQPTRGVGMPRMLMGFDFNVSDRDSSGKWRLDTTMAKVALAPKNAQQEKMATILQSKLEGMQGMVISYRFTRKGDVSDVKMDIPPGTPPEAQQILKSMSESVRSMVAPLPAEPVGVGAKWEVVTRSEAAGTDVLSFATYTMRSRTGPNVMLDVELNQLAASDSIHPPNMPPEASARMKSFRSSGNSTTNLHLETLGSEMQMELKMQMQVEIDGGDGGAPAPMTVGVALSMRSAPSR